jgi:hypothetical protein
MTPQTVTGKLLAAVRDLPPERQEQLLELVMTWALPLANVDGPPAAASLLHTHGRLDQDYLQLARSELRGPPDLATVRAALAVIPGSLTADCIAERDER